MKLSTLTATPGSGFSVRQALILLGAVTLLCSLWQPSLAQQRDRWQDAIEKLIDAGGPYGAGLDEAYRDYGRLLFETGDQQQAVQLYRQAWQISRINSGLFSEAQLTHLNQLIQGLVALQQWEEVHELHQLSFLIASRVYPPDDIRYVIAAEFYTSWKWKAINGRISFAGYANGFELAQDLSAFYEEVIDKIEHSDSDHTGRLARLIVGKAQTDISLARALVRSRSAPRLVNPNYITETQCTTGGFVQSNTSRQCRRVKLANYSLGESTVPSIHFALGRYLNQVETSITRLERIRSTADELSIAQRQWIESLIVTLENESEAVLRSAGLR